MKVHNLKVIPIFFNAILNGTKTFEARKDDRGYKVNDSLILNEWNDESKEFTGRTITKTISYILPGGQFGIEKGYCIIQLF